MNAKELKDNIVATIIEAIRYAQESASTQLGQDRVQTFGKLLEQHSVAVGQREPNIIDLHISVDTRGLFSGQTIHSKQGGDLQAKPNDQGKILMLFGLMGFLGGLVIGLPIHFQKKSRRF